MGRAKLKAKETYKGGIDNNALMMAQTARFFSKEVQTAHVLIIATKQSIRENLRLSASQAENNRKILVRRG